MTLRRVYLLFRPLERPDLTPLANTGFSRHGNTVSTFKNEIWQKILPVSIFEKATPQKITFMSTFLDKYICPSNFIEKCSF